MVEFEIPEATPNTKPFLRIWVWVCANVDILIIQMITIKDFDFILPFLFIDIAKVNARFFKKVTLC